MVTLRTKVCFSADFPNDVVYGDDGDEIAFAGRNVAEAISAMLSARGYLVDEPESWDEMGWSFDARLGKRRFWLLVTAIDEFIVQTENMTWRLTPDRAAFTDFLMHLQDGLESDPRIGSLRWFEGGWPPTEVEVFSGPVE